MAVDIKESVDALDVKSVFGESSDEPINLFGDEEVASEEEVAEEASETEGEEESQEETEESPEEEVKEEPKEEEKPKEEDKSSEVAENLKKALHAERAKRKEAAENVAKLNQQIQTMNQENSSYKEAYETVIASIKEYGLEDVIKLPAKAEINPEVLEARKIKQQQETQENVKKFYDFVRNEATSVAPEYTNVNLSNPEHGTALTQIITAAVVNGVDRETAVAEGMKVLNSIIATAKKEALKSRQPAVTPTAKPKARTKQSASASVDKTSPEGINKLFASMGKRMAGG